jgi:hypothetical protein
MRFIFSASTNPIVNDPRYNDYTKTFLTPNDLKTDKSLVDAELERVKKIIPESQKSIIDENGISIDKALFVQKLKQSIRYIEQQESFSDLTNSELVAGTGLTSGYKIGEIPEQSDAENKRELASIQRLIRERQENLAEIDGFILRLLLGKPFQAFSSSSKNKFIKLADDMEKEADKVIEEYYDDLYEESEGSPNYGRVLNHPEKYHHTLTTDASTIAKPSKFKKI